MGYRTDSIGGEHQRKIGHKGNHQHIEEEQSDKHQIGQTCHLRLLNGTAIFCRALGQLIFRALPGNEQRNGDHDHGTSKRVPPINETNRTADAGEAGTDERAYTSADTHQTVALFAGKQLVDDGRRHWENQAMANTKNDTGNQQHGNSIKKYRQQAAHQRETTCKDNNLFDGIPAGQATADQSHYHHHQ